MRTTSISPGLINFLKDLKQNNNRPWFNEHKDRYKSELAHFKEFTAELLTTMQKYDNIEKLKVFRIYRDIRFSKDKTPYKSHFSASLRRATRLLRGSYYIHIEPGNSMIAGGFWGPGSDDLKRIRQEIFYEYDALRKILNNPVFIKTFGRLEGEKVKTAPQGYTKDDPAIDLLRYKQFLLRRSCSDGDIIRPGFLDSVVDTFRNMRPFFDFMSEALTTDADGRTLYR